MIMTACLDTQQLRRRNTVALTVVASPNFLQKIVVAFQLQCPLSEWKTGRKEKLTYEKLIRVGCESSVKRELNRR